MMNISQENLWRNFASFILLEYLHKTNSTYLHLPPGNAHVHSVTYGHYVRSKEIELMH